MNIGVTEALAIDEKHDEQTLIDVTRRECSGVRSEDALEQCKREIATEASRLGSGAKSRASSW